MTYINIHTHTPASNALTQADFDRALPPGKYCLGIHPWSAGKVDAAPLLERLQGDPDVAAIGEIGLDYACDALRSAQARLFEDQLAIAAERGLPVVIHCVRAFDPVMKALARHELPAVIFHGFIGSLEQACRAIARGYCLSFGPRSLRSTPTRLAMQSTPLPQLFVETDDEPVEIYELYRQVADSYRVTVNHLARTTECNFKRIFG